MPPSSLAADLLRAAHFAADRHRDQRRKGPERSPYINHPIEVAELLATVGGVDDPVTLQAALLHDTLEDTDTDPGEIEARFGPEVRAVVEEVSDDKRLPSARRKALQIEHAPSASRRARQVKLADKTANVMAIAHAPPDGWSLARRREYLNWAEQVVAGLRGCNPPLEARFDQVLAEARRQLER
jgi:(p)ppGpp synthase/HD superfamily hydrolase